MRYHAFKEIKEKNGQNSFNQNFHESILGPTSWNFILLFFKLSLCFCLRITQVLRQQVDDTERNLSHMTTTVTF